MAARWTSRAAPAVLGIVGAAAVALAVAGTREATPAVLAAAVGGLLLGVAAAARGPAPERPPAQAAAAAAAPAAGPAPVRAEAGGAAAGAPPGPVPSAPGAPAGVAAVAHHMSSPLAAISANLEWLRDAFEHGRLRDPDGEDAGETREVLKDARAAAEALLADVRALREAGRSPAGPLLH